MLPIDVFESNPEMLAAVSPYSYAFETFTYKSISLGDTNPAPLSSQQGFPVELIIVVARRTNTGFVNLWGENLAAGVGIPLAASDIHIISVDNHVWELAEVLASFMQKKNPYSRRAVDPGKWFVQASAETQVVDICFAYGPPTLIGG